jgi:hypothetical protein
MAWFIAGGFIMWVLALDGVLVLSVAIDFARRPIAGKLERIYSLSRALTWSMVVGVAADLMAVGTKVPHNPAWAKSPDLPLLILEGFAESMAPLILGGALLSTVSLLVAAGHATLRDCGP